MVFIFCTLKTPSVNVPVLSNTTISVLAKASKSLLPLMRTPLLEAPPIPGKKLKGIDKTNAQGQDTTTEYRITTNYFSWYRFTR